MQITRWADLKLAEESSLLPSNNYSQFDSSVDGTERQRRFEIEADERVAVKLDRLLSDIERRVEAKEDIDMIQDRVEIGITECQPPGVAKSHRRMLDAHQGTHDIGHGHRHSTLENASQWPRETRKTVGGNSGNILMKPEVADPVTPNQSGGSIARFSQDAKLDLSSEETLREHMETLDRMMASVREAAIPLQDVEETPPLAQVKELQRSKPKFEKRKSKPKTVESNRKNEQEEGHGKTRMQLRKKQGIISGLKSALRESKLMVERQAVDAKAKSEQISALKRQIRRLQREMDDAAGASKNIREDAELARESLAKALNDLQKKYTGLEAELASANQRLMDAPPRIIVPTKQAPGMKAPSKEAERQMRKQYQIQLNDLERNHLESVQRLKAHMLRLEGSSGQKNEAYLNNVAGILSKQKERMIVAMNRQRKQFSLVVEELQSEKNDLKVEHAREIEALKNKLTSDAAQKRKSLERRLQEFTRIHEAHVRKIKKEHAEHLVLLEAKHRQHLKSRGNGATKRLTNVLMSNRGATADLKALKDEALAFKTDALQWASKFDRQRILLANKTQTIVGLEYQISEAHSQLEKYKRDAAILQKEVKSSKELLSELGRVSSSSHEVKLGENQDMTLSPAEAQNMIKSLGMRVMQLEDLMMETRQTKQTPNVVDTESMEKSGLEGFRHFERFSFMPKLLDRIGEALTACEQISRTLYLLREAPTWATDSLIQNHDPTLALSRTSEGQDDIFADDEVETQEAKVAVVAKKMKGETEIIDSPATRISSGTKTLTWMHDWGDHLATLSNCIDDMIGRFRKALTGFRAEIVDRKKYEEMMCLHFYKREQHWKALYEAVLCSAGRASKLVGTPVSSVSLAGNNFLSTGSKQLSKRISAQKADVLQPVLGDKKKEEGKDLKKTSKHNVSTSDYGQSGTSTGHQDADVPANGEALASNKLTSSSLKKARDASIRMIRVDFEGSNSSKQSKQIQPPHGIARTKSFMPSGICQSGTKMLETSAGGATFIETSRGRTNTPFSSVASREWNGWTPVPPSPTSISQFLGSSSRRNIIGARRGRGRLLSSHVGVGGGSAEMPSHSRPGTTTSTVTSISSVQRQQSPVRTTGKKFSSKRLKDSDRGQGIYVGGLAAALVS